MIVGDDLFEIERIEQLLLIPADQPHHHPPPSCSHQHDGITIRQPLQMTSATKSAISGRCASEQNILDHVIGGRLAPGII